MTKQLQPLPLICNSYLCLSTVVSTSVLVRPHTRRYQSTPVTLAVLLRYLGRPQDTEDKNMTSPKHRYDPDIIGIRQQRPPDPAITTGTNGGPRNDTLITALAVYRLQNQRF
jgi:hypothetical protein